MIAEGATPAKQLPTNRLRDHPTTRLRDHETIRLPDQDTEQEVRPDLDWQVDESFGNFGRVMIHNDDVTPYDFVVIVLRSVFRLSPPESERVTWEAHTRGQACVAVLPLEDAKYRVGKAHGAARQAGFPLTFTIESE